MTPPVRVTHPSVRAKCPFQRPVFCAVDISRARYRPICSRRMSLFDAPCFAPTSSVRVTDPSERAECPFRRPVLCADISRARYRPICTRQISLSALPCSRYPPCALQTHLYASNVDFRAPVFRVETSPVRATAPRVSVPRLLVLSAASSFSRHTYAKLPRDFSTSSSILLVLSPYHAGSAAIGCHHCWLTVSSYTGRTLPLVLLSCEASTSPGATTLIYVGFIDHPATSEEYTLSFLKCGE